MGLAAKLARSELSLSQQRWFFSEQAAKFLSSNRQGAPVGPQDVTLEPLGLGPVSPNARDLLRSQWKSQLADVPTGSERLSEAFQEVEQLLRTGRPAQILESKETPGDGMGLPYGIASPNARSSVLQHARSSVLQHARSSVLQPSPLNKVRSAPTLPKVRQAKPVEPEPDSDDESEEVKKAKLAKGPKRSVALKIAARRVLDIDPPELPMSKHKVQGIRGLEHHELVNIGALQNSCELLGESVTVDTMLVHRRQRELKDRQKPPKRAPKTSASRSLSWEERQEQVMVRRQQRWQEQAYRRIAATRSFRKLCRSGSPDAASDFAPQVSEGDE